MSTHDHMHPQLYEKILGSASASGARASSGKACGPKDPMGGEGMGFELGFRMISDLQPARFGFWA